MTAPSQNIGYVRVSTTDQNTVRQLHGITLDRVFTESQSGYSTEGRPVWLECRSYLREGDILHVHSIDRLARNLGDLQRIVQDLVTRGIVVKFHSENLTFNGAEPSNPFNLLMLHVLGAVAEFERALIRERQREGIAAARRSGKKWGRPVTIAKEDLIQIQYRLETGWPVTAIARELDVSRQTIYRVKRKLENGNYDKRNTTGKAP